MKGTANQGRNCRMVMTDISEQKRTTGALLQTRSAQEALLNTIPAMTFFKDMSLRYTAVSQGRCGFPRPADCGHSGQDEFRPDPRESRPRKSSRLTTP